VSGYFSVKRRPEAFLIFTLDYISHQLHNKSWYCSQISVAQGQTHYSECAFKIVKNTKCAEIFINVL